MRAITCSNHNRNAVPVPTRRTRRWTRWMGQREMPKRVLRRTFMASLLVLFVCSHAVRGGDVMLLTDEFNGLRSGMFSRVLGAHTEYHHIPEAAPKGNWAISCFGTGLGPQRAWRIMSDDGKKMMYQSYDNKREHTHPM